MTKCCACALGLLNAKRCACAVLRSPIDASWLWLGETKEWRLPGPLMATISLVYGLLVIACNKPWYNLIELSLLMQVGQVGSGVLIIKFV